MLYAFAALSKILTVEEGAGPALAGINFTVSSHCWFGDKCRGQFVAPAANPNTCGVVTGDTLNPAGLAKVIGGCPSWAELLSMNVTDFSCPTFTLPKLYDIALIFKFPGTGVAVGVGVGVFLCFLGLGVFVAVGVDVAVAVGVAVKVAVGVNVVVAVALGVAVMVVVAVCVDVDVEDAVVVGVAV